MIRVNDAKWYVLWVMSGEERRLLRKVKPVDSVVDALVPIEGIWERKAGLWREVEKIAFPGYLFVRCIITAELYYRLRNLDGVINWLGRDGTTPSSVPDEEMVLVELLAGGTAQEIAQKIPLITNVRKRRASGKVTLMGKEHRITIGWHNKQPETGGVDSSPAAGNGDQTEADHYK